MPIANKTDFGFLTAPTLTGHVKPPSRPVDRSQLELARLRTLLAQNKAESAKVRALCDERRAEEQACVEAQRRQMEALRQLVYRYSD
jgi:hypothetical protein